jgi:hypothetical protein
MNRFIDRLKLFFLGVFAISCIGVWAYQLLWVAPEKRCEAHGDWWDPHTRVCATPIYLPNLTGRPAGKLDKAQLKARAEDAQTREARLLGLQSPVQSSAASGQPSAKPTP